MTRGLLICDHLDAWLEELGWHFREVASFLIEVTYGVYHRTDHGSSTAVFGHGEYEIDNLALNLNQSPLTRLIRGGSAGLPSPVT